MAHPVGYARSELQKKYRHECNFFFQFMVEKMPDIQCETELQRKEHLREEIRWLLSKEVSKDLNQTNQLR